MRVRFGANEIKLHALINYIVLLTLVLTNISITIMNIVEQLYPVLIHLPTQQTQLGCNGHPELCNRSYSNVTQLATHDAPFVGILPMDNQNVHVEKQLDAGIRFLQAQTRLDRIGKLSLCHTNCGMKDAGLLTNFLSVIKVWLDNHPREVVTLLLTNPEWVNITHFAHSFNISGASQYAYTPLPSHNRHDLTTWPTLQTLINQNTRLIIFIDAPTSSPGAPKTPYILPEFDYFWETPFDVTSPSALNSCVIDRPHFKNPQEAQQRMYIVNHFLDTHMFGVDVPDRRDAKSTNARMGEGSIGKQVERCVEMHGRKPKGVLVDYFDRGEGLGVQDALNGVV